MPYYLAIAFKNIFRDRKRSFTLGINYFFISFLLLLVFSVTTGLKTNITSNVLTSTAGHITIAGEYIVNGRTYQGIKDYPKISRIVTRSFPDARVITRYALSSAVYYKDLSKRLSFTGIDLTTDRGLKDQISCDENAWKKFEERSNYVIIPESVAKYFGLTIDDEILVATRTRKGAFNTATIKIAGVYTTGNYFLREMIISQFGFLQSLDLSDSTIASKMFLFFDSPRAAREYRGQLIESLGKTGFVATKPSDNNDALNAVSAASPRYKVEDTTLTQTRLTLATADEVTGIVSQVITAVNSSGLFIAAVMLFIISVSIFINMRMTINERMQEIGTLRAMGAEQGDIIRLFVMENVFLSLLFTLIGFCAALFIIFLFSTFIPVPADGTMGLFVNRGRIVLQPTVPAAIFITFALVAFTMLFSFFPARRGGKIPPVVALSTTN
jgi:ABC-type lipoprotein release transport system permease subunit